MNAKFELLCGITYVRIEEIQQKEDPLSDRQGIETMFRMWGKIIKDNHMLHDTVINISDYSMSRTAMVFQALDEMCYEFDLGKPIWLDATVNDFKKHNKARFTKDNFIETIEFDYLEIQVIEE